MAFQGFDSHIVAGLGAYSGHTLAIAGGVVALYIGYQIVSVVYSIYLSPISHVPGPKLAAACRVPYVRRSMNGTLLPWLQQIHEQYGPIVRYSPNEISVISGDNNPWEDIYGFRIGRNKHTGTFEKDKAWYPVPPNRTPSVLSTAAADHGRQRKILSHAFSDKALRKQEGLIQRYVNLLIDRLREISEQNSPELGRGGDSWDADGNVELCRWYNGFTFDVIGDLCFSVPFGSLHDRKVHPWVMTLLESIKGLRLFYLMSYWPWTKYLGSLIIDKHQLEERRKFNQWTMEKTQARVAMDTTRPDFVTAILEHQQGRFGGEDSKEADTLRLNEMVSNIGLFLIAGTETTATTLSTGTNLLLQNPQVLSKLKTEIRERFQNDADITIEAVSHMEYLSAFINEVLRYFPPVPVGFLRKVPETGADVAGVHLPANSDASISVSQFVANRSPLNFTDPDVFDPDRWLSPSPEKYKNDNFAIVQPFSFGPRNCLGKNLAWAELRLVLTKMIFHFDWKLDPRSEDWEKRVKHYALFARPDLWVKLTPVVGA